MDSCTGVVQAQHVAAVLVGVAVVVAFAAMAVVRATSRREPVRPPRRVRERDAYHLAELAGQRATVARGAEQAIAELGH